MASDVVMPRLSDSMEEGTVLKWLVDEGAEVKRGEALVEIETDKANMTYDADTDGVLVEIVAQEGDTLPIGEVIARIGEAGEAKQGGEQAEAEPEQAEEPEAEEPRPKRPSRRTPRRSRPRPRRRPPWRRPRRAAARPRRAPARQPARVPPRATAPATAAA